MDRARRPALPGGAAASLATSKCARAKAGAAAPCSPASPATPSPSPTPVQPLPSPPPPLCGLSMAGRAPGRAEAAPGVGTLGAEARIRRALGGALGGAGAPGRALSATPPPPQPQPPPSRMMASRTRSSGARRGPGEVGTSRSPQALVEDLLVEVEVTESLCSSKGAGASSRSTGGSVMEVTIIKPTSLNCARTLVKPQLSPISAHSTSADGAHTETSSGDHQAFPAPAVPGAPVAAPAPAKGDAADGAATSPPDAVTKSGDADNAPAPPEQGAPPQADARKREQGPPRECQPPRETPKPKRDQEAERERARERPGDRLRGKERDETTPSSPSSTTSSIAGAPREAANPQEMVNASLVRQVKENALRRQLLRLQERLIELESEGDAPSRPSTAGYPSSLSSRPAQLPLRATKQKPKSQSSAKVRETGETGAGERTASSSVASLPDAPAPPLAPAPAPAPAPVASLTSPSLASASNEYCHLWRAICDLERRIRLMESTASDVDAKPYDRGAFPMSTKEPSDDLPAKSPSRGSPRSAPPVHASATSGSHSSAPYGRPATRPVTEPTTSQPSKQPSNFPSSKAQSRRPKHLPKSSSTKSAKGSFAASTQTMFASVPKSKGGEQRSSSATPQRIPVERQGAWAHTNQLMQECLRAPSYAASQTVHSSYTRTRRHADPSPEYGHAIWTRVVEPHVPNQTVTVAHVSTPAPRMTDRMRPPLPDAGRATRNGRRGSPVKNMARESEYDREKSTQVRTLSKHRNTLSSFFPPISSRKSQLESKSRSAKRKASRGSTSTAGTNSKTKEAPPHSTPISNTVYTAQVIHRRSIHAKKSSTSQTPACAFPDTCLAMSRKPTGKRAYNGRNQEKAASPSAYFPAHELAQKGLYSSAPVQVNALTAVGPHGQLHALYAASFDACEPPPGCEAKPSAEERAAESAVARERLRPPDPDLHESHVEEYVASTSFSYAELASQEGSKVATGGQEALAPRASKRKHPSRGREQVFVPMASLQSAATGVLSSRASPSSPPPSATVHPSTAPATSHSPRVRRHSQSAHSHSKDDHGRSLFVTTGVQTRSRTRAPVGHPEEPWCVESVLPPQPVLSSSESESSSSGSETPSGSLEFAPPVPLTSPLSAPPSGMPSALPPAAEHALRARERRKRRTAARGKARSSEDESIGAGVEGGAESDDGARAPTGRELRALVKQVVRQCLADDGYRSLAREVEAALKARLGPRLKVIKTADGVRFVVKALHQEPRRQRHRVDRASSPIEERAASASASASAAASASVAAGRRRAREAAEPNAAVAALRDEAVVTSSSSSPSPMRRSPLGLLARDSHLSPLIEDSGCGDVNVDFQLSSSDLDRMVRRERERMDGSLGRGAPRDDQGGGQREDEMQCGLQSRRHRRRRRSRRSLDTPARGHYNHSLEPGTTHTLLQDNETFLLS